MLNIIWTILCLLCIYVFYRALFQSYRHGMFHRLRFSNNVKDQRLQSTNLMTYKPQIGDILICKFGNSWKNYWPFNHTSICVDDSYDEPLFLECQWNTSRRGIMLLEWSTVKDDLLSFSKTHPCAYRYHIRKPIDIDALDRNCLKETAKKLCNYTFATDHYQYLIFKIILGLEFKNFTKELWCSAAVADILNHAQAVKKIDRLSCTPYTFSSTSGCADLLCDLYADDIILKVV